MSIDGLAAFYLDDPRADLPNLRRLRREGASARRMQVPFPSLTWTVHSSLVTGVSPARHGVISNHVFDRKKGEKVAFIGHAVFDKEEALRAPTLYDAAHRAGLRTAAVIWPCSNGASTLDWMIPDSNQEAIHLRYTTPGLAAELERAGLSIAPLGRWGWDHLYSAPRDDLYTRIGAWLLAEKRPHVLLLHLITPDGFEHDHGPRSPEAYWAVRFADERIGELRRALEAPALRGRAALLVVSDHGFLGHEREVRLNAFLRGLGLVEADAEGKKAVSRRAWAVSGGGSAGIYALEEEPAARAALVEKLAGSLAGLEGVERVLGPAEFVPLGLPHPRDNPLQADLMVTAREGYAFSEELAGEVVSPLKQRKGAHGHLPGIPDMGAVFIAWGAGVREGVVLEEVRAEDVAPTAARLLGLELPSAEGRILEEALR